jgi:hypothetical protein
MYHNKTFILNTFENFEFKSICLTAKSGQTMLPTAIGVKGGGVAEPAELRGGRGRGKGRGTQIERSDDDNADGSGDNHDHDDDDSFSTGSGDSSDLTPAPIKPKPKVGAYVAPFNPSRPLRNPLPMGKGGV